MLAKQILYSGNPLRALQTQFAAMQERSEGCNFILVLDPQVSTLFLFCLRLDLTMWPSNPSALDSQVLELDLYYHAQCQLPVFYTDHRFLDFLVYVTPPSSYCEYLPAKELAIETHPSRCSVRHGTSGFISR